jgi:NAD(P)-dependent dehydrogenase (short-subunit alcohol dehydrogenase family)
MSLLLEGKVAVITGAASRRGIGKATAQRFAGMAPASLARSMPPVEAAAADIGKAHRGYGCDVAEPRNARRDRTHPR